MDVFHSPSTHPNRCASFGWEAQFFPQQPYHSLGQVFLFLVPTLFLCS